MIGKEDLNDEIYIIGETHTDEGYAKMEERIVREMKPGYVLHEGLDDSEYKDIKNMAKKINKIYTLKDISEYMAKNFEEDPSFTPRNSEGYQQRMPDEDTPFLDASYDQLIAVNEAVGERLIEESEEYVKWKNEGERDDNMYDKKIIALKDIQDTLFKYADWKGSPGNNSGKRVIKAVEELREQGYETKIAGCDIDKQKYFSDKNEEEIEEEVHSKEFNERREQKMAERIAEKAEETDEGVVCIIGQSHADNVKEELDERGYNVKTKKPDLADEEATGFEKAEEKIEAMLYSKETLDLLS